MHLQYEYSRWTQGNRHCDQDRNATDFEIMQFDMITVDLQLMTDDDSAKYAITRIHRPKSGLMPSVIPRNAKRLCKAPAVYTMYNIYSLWQVTQNHDAQDKRTTQGATSLTDSDDTASESDRRVSRTTNMTPCLGGGLHFTMIVSMFPVVLGVGKTTAMFNGSTFLF